MKPAVLFAAVLGFALTASAQSGPPPALRGALIAALSAPPAAGASSTSRAVVFPVGGLRAQLASYIAEAKAKGSAGATLEDFGSYRLTLSVRGRSGGAEVHAHWDDVMIVEQGSAILVTGGRVIGGRTGADGETRGVRIEGGQRQEVGAGDILTVRAGTPHQLLLAPGTVYSAFVIKVREP
jgi:mannose-6-phosphate isomerase-like protein (cupin superfamily)